jgi:heme-based aerotactic transducer
MKSFIQWKKKTKDQGSFISTPIESSKAEIHIHPELRRQIDLIGLTTYDISLLKSVKPFFEEHIEELVSTFYDKILTVPHLRQMIQQHSTVVRLKQTLRCICWKCSMGTLMNYMFKNGRT